MFTAKYIVDQIGIPSKIVGYSKVLVNKVRTPEDADSHSLIWIANNKHDREAIINCSAAKLIVCDYKLEITKIDTSIKTLILTPDPRLFFLNVVRQFFTPDSPRGIYPSAVIHPEAVIGKNVFIGPNCIIGKVIIGDDCSLHGNVYLYDNVCLGDRVVIKPGTVIGGEGYGYQKNAEGVWEKFPHVGGVIVEDDVEIGGNTCIDRGTLGNTLIKKGAKIDNLVHIAHNVIIGERTMVIAHSQIAGSSVVGDDVWISPSCTLAKSVIGNCSTIGIGSVVIRNIREKEMWFGNPAKKMITPGSSNK
jgi:UDP-3-O-[3-hydroxymyristoyl] glucosamine N-acyltransferase